MQILTWPGKRRLIMRQLSHIDTVLAERAEEFERSWQARGRQISDEFSPQRRSVVAAPSALPLPSLVTKPAPAVEFVAAQEDETPDYLR